MVVKLIICDVLEAKREAFANGQRAWKALANVDGFLGQTGGWSVGDSNRAVITAFWQDQASYDRFMRNEHDTIFDNNAQRGTFQESDITIWRRVYGIPGSLETFSQAVSKGGFLRIALCQVKEHRTDNFETVQRKIWNPGMEKAAGMLGGAFSRSTADPNKYLVCTFWRSAANHQAYRTDVFPPLCARARIEDDCDSVSGILVDIEPAWRVQTSSCA